MSTRGNKPVAAEATNEPEQAPPAAPPTVVITGATSGFGEALAHHLADLGANVVVAGRDPDRAAAVALAVGAGRALGVACDVRQADDMAALWQAAVDRFGTVDHWINNAGVGHRNGRLDEIPIGETEAVLATNLTGALLGARQPSRA